MSASSQTTSVERLSEAEKLYLQVFQAVENQPKRVLPRRIMNLAMQTIHGWNKKQTEAVCRSLIEKRQLYRHTKQRIGNVPEQRKTKQSGHCVYCRKLTKRLTVDHVIPRSKGGSDEDWNCVDCCESCNLSKADRDPVEWARDILAYRKPITVSKPRIPIALRIKLAVAILFSLVGGQLR